LKTALVHNRKTYRCNVQFLGDLVLLVDIDLVKLDVRFRS